MVDERAHLRRRCPLISHIRRSAVRPSRSFIRHRAGFVSGETVATFHHCCRCSCRPEPFVAAVHGGVHGVGVAVARRSKSPMRRRRRRGDVPTRAKIATDGEGGFHRIIHQHRGSTDLDHVAGCLTCTNPAAAAPRQWWAKAPNRTAWSRSRDALSDQRPQVTGPTHVHVGTQRSQQLVLDIQSTATF